MPRSMTQSGFVDSEREQIIATFTQLNRMQMECQDLNDKLKMTWLRLKDNMPETPSKDIVSVTSTTEKAIHALEEINAINLGQAPFLPFDTVQPDPEVRNHRYHNNHNKNNNHDHSTHGSSCSARSFNAEVSRNLEESTVSTMTPSSGGSPPLSSNSWAQNRARSHGAVRVSRQWRREISPIRCPPPSICGAHVEPHGTGKGQTPSPLPLQSPICTSRRSVSSRSARTPPPQVRAATPGAPQFPSRQVVSRPDDRFSMISMDVVQSFGLSASIVHCHGRLAKSSAAGTSSAASNGAASPPHAQHNRRQSPPKVPVVFIANGVLPESRQSGNHASWTRVASPPPVRVHSEDKAVVGGSAFRLFSPPQPQKMQQTQQPQCPQQPQQLQQRGSVSPARSGRHRSVSPVNSARCANSCSSPGVSRSVTPPRAMTPMPSQLKTQHFRNQFFDIGAASLAGWKDGWPMWENQDAHRVTLVDTSKLVVVVCDGHNIDGKHAAELACTLLTGFACTVVRQSAEVHPGVLRDAFLSTHMALETRGLAETGGCTATVAFIDALAQTITVAHVGDSRLAVLQGGRVLFETTDHIFDEEAEAQVRNSGGEVRSETIHGSTARRLFQRGSNYPGLAMSRSLGDASCHRLGVVADPTVQAGLRFAPGSSLVVASDGIWEHMPSSSVAHAVESARNRSSLSSPACLASQGLVDGARGLSSRRANADDVTAVVVDFLDMLAVAS